MKFHSDAIIVFQVLQHRHSNRAGSVVGSEKLACSVLRRYSQLNHPGGCAGETPQNQFRCRPINSDKLLRFHQKNQPILQVPFLLQRTTCLFILLLLGLNISISGATQVRPNFIRIRSTNLYACFGLGFVVNGLPIDWSKLDKWHLAKKTIGFLRFNMLVLV